MPERIKNMGKLKTIEFKIKKIKIPVEYNWFKTEKSDDGKELIISFVKSVDYKN